MFHHSELTLRKLSRDDLPRLLHLKAESWFGTHRVTFLHSDDQEQWFRSLDSCNQVFVAGNGTDTVGIFKVFRIDWQNRTAEVGWDVFAEYRGCGYGKRLVAAGSALCFSILNLRRLNAEVLATNFRSQHCAHVNGYVLEGRRRQAVERNRQLLDSYVYGLIADEFFDRRPRVNYLLATWSGARRYPAPSATFYLERHLQSLQELPHNLTQVTLLVPYNPEEATSFSEYLANCPRKLGTAHVEILRRPNLGLSYGGYSHAYSIYRRAFDYYIFMEDDYVFCQPFFDRNLIELFRKEARCGLMAGLVLGAGIDLHGAVSNGISSSEVMEEIWQRYDGELPFARHAGTYDSSHQIEFTRVFQIGGRPLRDVTTAFRTVYNDLGVRREFGAPHLPILMEPIAHDDAKKSAQNVGQIHS